VKKVDGVESRIIGGQTADVGEYPYYVDLGGCGGTLIAPSVVLSASHCEPEGQKMIGREVRVSAYSLYWMVDDGSQRATIINQTNHPQFDAQSINNDYMLLHLDSSFILDTDVEIVLSQDINDVAPGTQLTVLGLGITSQSTGLQPDELMDVTVNAVSDEDCTDVYSAGPEGVIIENMFCAGNFGVGGKDACNGDSGGNIRHLN
jgi:secreted trypsin-like serine protease